MSLLHSMNSNGRARATNGKIALILGGGIDPERRKAAAKKEKPRIDVLEMEQAHHAVLYDYQWFSDRAEREPATRLLHALARRFGHWSEFLTLRAVWSLQDTDVVYATGEDVGFPLAALLRILRMKKPRIVLRMEQPAFGSTPRRRKLYRSFLRFAVPRIAAILCRTEAHVAYLQQNADVSTTQVFFVPETTDTGFFDRSNPPVDWPALRTLPKPFIVSAGLEMRDYESLAAAVRDLPVTALICAGSPWAKVRYDANGDQLPENVVIRSFSQPEMREIYRQAEFAVLPILPTQRACGMNVVLEAWAMGRAVIASRTEGLVSYIQDGGTGLFVTPSNVDELRGAILFLLSNPGEAERLGSNGYQKVHTELCMERYLDTVHATIDRAIQ